MRQLLQPDRWSAENDGRASNTLIQREIFGGKQQRVRGRSPQESPDTRRAVLPVASGGQELPQRRLLSSPKMQPRDCLAVGRVQGCTGVPESPLMGPRDVASDGISFGVVEDAFAFSRAALLSGSGSRRLRGGINPHSARLCGGVLIESSKGVAATSTAVSSGSDVNQAEIFSSPRRLRGASEPPTAVRGAVVVPAEAAEAAQNAPASIRPGRKEATRCRLAQPHRLRLGGGPCRTSFLAQAGNCPRPMSARRLERQQIVDSMLVEEPDGGGVDLTPRAKGHLGAKDGGQPSPQNFERRTQAGGMVQAWQPLEPSFIEGPMKQHGSESRRFEGGDKAGERDTALQECRTDIELRTEPHAVCKGELAFSAEEELAAADSYAQEAKVAVAADTGGSIDVGSPRSTGAGGGTGVDGDDKRLPSPVKQAAGTYFIRTATAPEHRLGMPDRLQTPTLAALPEYSRVCSPDTAGGHMEAKVQDRTTTTRGMMVRHQRGAEPSTVKKKASAAPRVQHAQAAMNFREVAEDMARRDLERHRAELQARIGKLDSEYRKQEKGKSQRLQKQIREDIMKLTTRQ